MSRKTTSMLHNIIRVETTAPGKDHHTSTVKQLIPAWAEQHIIETCLVEGGTREVPEG